MKTLRQALLIHVIVLFGIGALVAITNAIEQPPTPSVVDELPPNSALLDMSKLSELPEPGEDLSGGATTILDTSFHSFGRGPMNLVDFSTTWTIFRDGRKLFDRNWYVSIDGHVPLGPNYNAGSCAHCHNSDGRGRPPLTPDEAPESMIVRLSVPDGSGSKPEPTYGEQLSYYSLDTNVAPEGTFTIDYEEIEGHFADGGTYSLRSPSYTLRNLGYGSAAIDVQISPRVAPANFGLGLLEAIPERAILDLADPFDRNGDGISGRPNYVRDTRTGKDFLGRFGWKANQPTLAQQVLKALNADIGITSSLYPSDGAHTQSARNAASHRDTSTHDGTAGPEITDRQFDLLLYYTRLLAPPARRHWTESTVQHGKAIFREIGCNGCHIERFTTGEIEGYPELSSQVIRPFTDLLLHDMGDGLADNRPDFVATGREWRTAPLWGIGLVKAVSGHTLFLHDGRARNIEEAILWHGGEGAASQVKYRRLGRNDRAAILAFLNSL